jgi:ATP-binding cassette, subfamily B, bacterial
MGINQKSGTFRYFRQLERKDCGPTCLRMIAAFHGRQYPTQYLSEICHVGRMGASLAGLEKGAENIGFDTFATTLTLEELFKEAPLPAILFWKKRHYIVLVGPAKGAKKHTHVIIADPETGKVTMPVQRLLDNWLNEGSDSGYVLLTEPKPDFYVHDDPRAQNRQFKGLPIWQSIKTFRHYFFQIALGMLVAAGINLFFPVLTKLLVDKGVQEKNVDMIAALLFAQLALFAGNILVEIIRSWSVLYINARINIKIISDFLIKLIRLPIGFFDTRLMTDIMLRIDDHERIEEFLSSSSLNVLFSAVSVTALSVVFCFYSPALFLIFLVGSLISVAWVVYFLKKRKTIDYNRFELTSNSRNLMYEMIDGMTEIKLNNAEKSKRFEWERQQLRMYDVNKSALKIEQIQHIGFNAITHVKSLLITFFAAFAVVDGSITLGVMLSIAMLVGQLNQPLEDFVRFFQSLQYARISIDRLNDIYSKKDEAEQHAENIEKERIAQKSALPEHIRIDQIGFSYNGVLGPDVFKNLSLDIPLNKVTAIVGSSGSGKTTLFKLLLKFYEPAEGSITVDRQALPAIHPDAWRSRCGVVMQDGYIFSDSILRNIAVREEKPDLEKVREACRVANIDEFVNTLPLGFSTEIGGGGIGLSAGQKQRILIARAVYKNPDFLFFDEATSALDAKNEKTIVENLKRFYTQKTVLIIAHRLSTVRDADKIVVLDKGAIAEQGAHEELIARRGFYYELIKNQLELGD